MTETESSSLEAEPPSSAPRSARQLVHAAFRLYRRHPGLFFTLAAGVIGPYELVVLAATGTGPLAHGSLSFGVSNLLTLIELTVIGPLVSALHVHAVKEVTGGREPRLVPIAREGLRVLPVVVAAAVISSLGIYGGILLLVVPGVILWLRWFVVAQVAAIEHEGWLPALRRSRQLTAGNYRHLFVFAIYLGLITFVPTLLVGFAFGHKTTTVASFLVGVLLQIATQSFAALAAGLLYFDLRARFVSAPSPVLTEDRVDAGADHPPIGHPSDPRNYEDHDRPTGWYVDPSAPKRMRFWAPVTLPAGGAAFELRGRSDEPGGRRRKVRKRRETIEKALTTEDTHEAPNGVDPNDDPASALQPLRCFSAVLTRSTTCSRS